MKADAAQPPALSGAGGAFIGVERLSTGQADLMSRQMLDISKWDQDDDPITREQVEVLNDILAGELTEEALEGFLIVSSRLVDEFGNHRTAELEKIFRTKSPAGREVLRASLEHVCRWVGGMEGYAAKFPVTVIPPRPAFPLFKIIGIHNLADRIYRVLDSRADRLVTGPACPLP